MKRYVIESTLVYSETISPVNVEEACRICQVDIDFVSRTGG